MKCPCHSGKSYKKCCEPFICGEKVPATPEALMRSRYTAYTQTDVDYIAKTMKGVVARGFNKENSKKWAEQTQWLDLKVLNTSIDNKNKNIGFVEFIAHYTHDGQKQIIHEISEFHKEDNAWFYVEGKTPKVGRNDPCPCGSGKKYKKCCFKN